jgi:hypothetical protein
MTVRDNASLLREILFICRLGCWRQPEPDKILSLGENHGGTSVDRGGIGYRRCLLGKKSKTRRVKFMAKKPVSVPVKVGFKTGDGKKVAFSAHKTVKKKVPVSFRAKRK